jgi:outer membrane protein TolC
LGEAARSERVNAEAAMAQIRLQQQQAGQRLQEARSRLAARFPGLPVPPAATLPSPDAPEGTAETYVEAVLAHNHELARARQHAAVLHAEVQQRASRRSVDPNLGVFYKHEAGGDERVLGLNVSVTLPGAGRRLDEAAAVELSRAADEAVVRLEQRLRTEAHADFEAAVARGAGWQEAERAAHALAAAATLAARAYGLGEGSLDQVLLMRRLALEGELLARQAQTDALAAQARLKLDAHVLWPLDVDAGQAHAHP